MRVVQVVGPTPSAVSEARTTLRTLARGYRAAGHTVVRVVPGAGDRPTHDGDAVRVTVTAPRVPGTAHRMFVSGRRLLRALDDIRPDRIEVSGPFAPQAVGRWARGHRVPTVVITHGRLDAAFAPQVGSPRLAWFLADFWNLRLVTSFDTIVCTTDDGYEEFQRLGTPNVVTVPNDVDLVDSMLAVHGMPVRQAA